jgi:protein-S-isoprenylcysteine O-methyltransferase Ste14
MRNFPGIILTATIWAYWLGVGAMIVRVRRKTRRSAGVMPHQPIERLMWILWVPLVAAWNILPYLALVPRGPVLLQVPAFALQDPGYAVLRGVAALGAVIALALTAWCWARMGSSWSMAIRERDSGELITDGLFAYVRHPIYALSMMLMLCSVVILPTLPMAALGVVHFALNHIKACNEERHMLKVHGPAYAAYMGRTGRFLPRVGSGIARRAALRR